MFQTISIVVVTLRQQRAIQTSPTFERFLPLLAVSNTASQRGWAQNWAHEFLGRCKSFEQQHFARSLQLALGAGWRAPAST